MILAKGEGDKVRNQAEVTCWSFIVFLLPVTHRKNIELL